MHGLLRNCFNKPMMSLSNREARREELTTQQATACLDRHVQAFGTQGNPGKSRDAARTGIESERDDTNV